MVKARELCGIIVNSLQWRAYSHDKQFTWQEAMDIAQNHRWRIPTIKELKGFYDSEMHKLVNIKPYYYWSSTTYALGTTYAWNVSFNYGSVNASLKTNAHYVICVRDVL